MPRNYIKKKTAERYSRNDFLRAVSDVKNKNSTYRQASQEYYISVAVIFHRIKGRSIPETKMGAGRSTALSAEVEEQIVECLKARARMGYPCNKEKLRDLVAAFVQQRHFKTPFKDGRPGLDWYYSFMNRNKTLSFKKPEHLQKARKDQKKPEVIYNFYKKLKVVVIKEKIDDAMFVFNADESGFGNDPLRIRAIGERGKTLSRISGGSGRESTSVLACVAADGSFLPPFIIFKGGAVQARWTSPKAYPGIVYSVSTNGWMEEAQFFNWFESVFVKWVKDLKVTKNLPDQNALLLYDGHKSHMRLRIIECALDDKIVLVKFPSHLTDRLQPLDKCVFGPVKTCWEKELIAHGKKHMGHGAGRLKKNEFTELLADVWKEAFTERNIIFGFVTTGIFSVNAGKFPENEFNSTDLERFKEQQRKAGENDGIRQGEPEPETNDTEEARVEQLRSFPSTSACSKTNCITEASDIVAEFSSAIVKTLNVDSNRYSAEPKKVTPRLKQARYEEVLTTAEVVQRLKETERQKDEKTTRKNNSNEKRKRKRKKDSGSREENEIVPHDENSDGELNQDEWAEEVVAETYPEVEYTLPEWHLILPGIYLLVKFRGGSRNSITYKYVCRVRDVDEETGDIEVVGFRRNDRLGAEYVEKETDISLIEFGMIDALLPNPKTSEEK
ncbi:hypothetical protein JTB14_027952 [Gonioctena quinquepunctata]|nr:hypothetical protein JTB14_027952 [Gonioctena quinquepunctata]